MAAFEDALAVVFEAEGGLADHPDDRGGRTNLGLTTETWRLWLDSRGEPPRPVDDATPADARAIYKAWYWERGKCGDLPWPLSLVHFDGCVNHGVLAANKLLQRSLGVVVDGVVGPITLGEANRGDPRGRAETLIWGRMAQYRSILMADHSQRAFAAGWIGRMIDLRAVVVGERGRVGGGPKPEAPNESPMLRLGDQGVHVEWLQRLLREYGPSVDPNGAYDQRTEEAVREFQADEGLTVDGVAGPETWTRLLFEEQDGG